MNCIGAALSWLFVSCLTLQGTIVQVRNQVTETQTSVHTYEISSPKYLYNTAVKGQGNSRMLVAV